MRLIKRYSNRKLYDTLAKSYITLESIAHLVLQDEKIQIIENDTGEDITAVILSQIIAERTRKNQAYSPSLLIELIKKGSGSMYGYARKIGQIIGEKAYSVEEEIEQKVKKLVSKEEEMPRKEIPQILEKPYLSKIEEQIETAMEKVLSKVNIPSKKEITNLTDMVNYLAERIQILEQKNPAPAPTPIEKAHLPEGEKEVQ